VDAYGYVDSESYLAARTKIGGDRVLGILEELLRVSYEEVSAAYLY
jgi:hypothetical protein